VIKSASLKKEKNLNSFLSAPFKENFAFQTKLATATFPPSLNFTIPKCRKMSVESCKSCGLYGLPPYAGQNFHILHQKGINGVMSVFKIISAAIDNISDFLF